jgi:hypothetical protein
MIPFNSLRASLSSWFILLLPLLNLACSAPLIHSRAELAKSLGKRVTVEGTYGVDETGEHVRSGDLDVMLDVPPELLGWGRDSPPAGAQVRASGRVERGAMAMGVFIDEPTLNLRRGSAEHPLVPGFVLRDAKLERLEPPPRAAAK